MIDPLVVLWLQPSLLHMTGREPHSLRELLSSQLPSCCSRNPSSSCALKRYSLLSANLTEVSLKMLSYVSQMKLSSHFFILSIAGR